MPRYAAIQQTASGYYMPPSAARYDLLYRFVVYLEHSAQTPASSALAVFGANVAHFAFRKLRFAMLFSFGRTPLGRSIFIVNCQSAQKQMIRVAAFSIIAPVENAKVWWDRTISKNPCQTMTLPVSPAGVVPHGKTPVSFDEAPLPWPTLIIRSLLHSGPKQINVPGFKLDLMAGFSQSVSSFIHKFLYVEVRVREAVVAVLALAFYGIAPQESQAS